MSPFTGLIFGTMRTDRCAGSEMALQSKAGFPLAGKPQSSQVKDIPDRRMISVARLCACNQTDGSTPASLNTDTLRFSAEDWTCSWAESVFGKMPDARTKRPNIVVFMNPLPLLECAKVRRPAGCLKG